MVHQFTFKRWGARKRNRHNQTLNKSILPLLYKYSKHGWDCLEMSWFFANKLDFYFYKLSIMKLQIWKHKLAGWSLAIIQDFIHWRISNGPKVYRRGRKWIAFFDRTSSPFSIEFVRIELLWKIFYIPNHPSLYHFQHLHTPHGQWPLRVHLLVT